MIRPDDLRRSFERTYGAAPTLLVRAPGRVNLIGEHIDYCGLSVLPAAIDRAIWLAVRPNDASEVRVSTAAAGYDAVRFPGRAPIEPEAPGAWGNYARAAIEGLTGGAADPDLRGVPTPRVEGAVGLDALIASDLPIASGLSSSSALVVGVALAALSIAEDSSSPSALSDRASRAALAALLVRAERYVGTAGGGMDHAACLFGVAGCALRVDFSPLSAAPVRVPAEWRIVVADSGERAEKSGAAQATYNERGREARAAAGWALATLADLEVTPGSNAPFSAFRALDAHDGAIDELTASDPPPAFPRLRHILTEAARVRSAQDALDRADLGRFGALLDASHASLRDDYEVSTPRLDELVARAVDAGAAGARLTGAGLGGCIVAVSDVDRVEAVREALADAAPFVIRPSEGAEVRRL
ncbi:MAG: galactokinase [Gemmatimonadetes bacterium]|nr:galactokinase [Gemmatimonadota bacterium]